MGFKNLFKRSIANRMGLALGLLTGIIFSLLWLDEQDNSAHVYFPIGFYCCIAIAPIISAYLNGKLFSNYYVIPRYINQHVGLYAFSLGLTTITVVIFIVANILFGTNGVGIASLLFCSIPGQYIAYIIDPLFGRKSFEP